MRYAVYILDVYSFIYKQYVTAAAITTLFSGITTPLEKLGQNGEEKARGKLYFLPDVPICYGIKIMDSKFDVSTDVQKNSRVDVKYKKLIGSLCNCDNKVVLKIVLFKNCCAMKETFFLIIFQL